MKLKIILCVILALLAFFGASPWEGAAAAAPEGELPVTGRYVATNSFPRNTVVDIVNIETNRSTRVIVANTLNSPGLLALVSREAAELIGMRPGSIYRIRMVQPSDPIAYLRFKEGATAGIHDYDSGNLITEENYREETYQQTWDEPASEYPNVPSELPARSDSTVFVNGEDGIPGYVLEPEWGGPGAVSVVEVPYNNPPEEEYTEYADYPEEEYTEVVEDYPEEEYTEVVEDYPEEEYVEVVEDYPEEEKPEEIVENDPVEEKPEEIVENDPVEEKPEEIVEQEPIKEEKETEVADAKNYELVPTQENPPENDIYGIDPSSIIPEVSGKSADNDTFSIPRIYELNRGRYYVQIAALPSRESVENAVRQIDHDFFLSYKPVVYKDGDNWYRVLLGGESGLNQGESAAVLQRFKSIGYKDAFVRKM